MPHSANRALGNCGPKAVTLRSQHDTAPDGCRHADRILEGSGLRVLCVLLVKNSKLEQKLTKKTKKDSETPWPASRFGFF